MASHYPASLYRPHRVLIIGGGFTGVYTALHLEKSSRPEDHLEVTLISRENFFLYTPMLTEVATSAIETTHVINPIRTLFKRATFVEGEVVDVDLAGRCVTARLADGHQERFPYDHLVLAFGATTAFYGMKDVEEHAVPMKTLGDAIRVRNWVIQTLETAAVKRDRESRRELLTYVVVGGGFTGIELTGALNVFVRDALEQYPSIDSSEITVMVVEGKDRLLPEFDEDLASFAQKRLEEAGVEVRLGELVSGATAHEVKLKGGAAIRARTIVWASGVTPSPLAQKIDVPKDGRGWIVVNADLSVPGHAGIWALGDCAQIPNPLKPGTFQPALAQHGMREARQLARNILATTRGGTPQDFRYRTLGQLAMLGHHDGIGTLGPFKVRGYVAWVLWRSYYLFRLPRLTTKIRVAIDWTYEELVGRDISQIQTYDQPAPVEPTESSERETAATR